MSAIRKTTRSGEAGPIVYPFGGQSVRTPAPEQRSGIDRAGFTQTGRELAGALMAVEAATEIRQNRVRALKEQIARGEYRPDPRDVARKLLEYGF